MRLLYAALLGGLFIMLQPPPPALALSGACAVRCLPAQRACMRLTGDVGYCRGVHRRCAMRCMTGG